MLQTSTNEFTTLTNVDVRKTPLSALSPEDNAFFNSLKEELNTLITEPSTETLDTILNYSKSFEVKSS